MYHDILTYPPEGEVYAISDPTIAIMESMHKVADDVPLVVIVREPDAAFDACAKAFGVPLDKPFREKALRAFYTFVQPTRRAMLVKYEALDHAEVVQAISLWLTGKEIDERRLKTFQALHITEDVPRAVARGAANPQLRVVH